jgi:hypothetical protein
MLTNLRLILTSIIGAAVLAGAAPAADAQKRVVVLDIEGARTAKLQRSLSQLIGGEHRIIPATKYRRTAKRLRARKVNPRNVAKVSARLQADGVVQGMIVASRGRYTLSLRVREGSTGRTVKKIKVRLRRPRLSTRMKRALADKLLDAIEDISFNETVEEDVRPAVRKKVAKSFGTRMDDDGADEGDDGESVEDDNSKDEEETSASSSSKSSGSVSKGVERKAKKNIGAMKLAAGLAVSSRKLTFTTREGLDDLSPQGYKSGMSGGAYVSGEFFPLAMDDKNEGKKIRKLGFGFFYQQAMGLKTNVTDDMMQVTELTTKNVHYGVSVLWKHKFGKAASSPSIQASVGYNKLTFDIDRAAAPMNVIVDVPNVAYTYIDPGLALRYPLSPQMAVTAYGKAMLMTDAGEIQSQDQYGTAKVTGVDAGVRVDYKLAPRFVLQLEGRYMAVGFQFQGNGTQANARDGDPDTIDVGGALDNFIGGSAAIGYLF